MSRGYPHTAWIFEREIGWVIQITIHRSLATYIKATHDHKSYGYCHTYSLEGSKVMMSDLDILSNHKTQACGRTELGTVGHELLHAAEHICKKRAPYLRGTSWHSEQRQELRAAVVENGLILYNYYASTNWNGKKKRLRTKCLDSFVTKRKHPKWELPETWN